VYAHTQFVVDLTDPANVPVSHYITDN